MKLKFFKMHGIGNDYVFMEGFTQMLPQDPEELSREVSSYHTGVGSDGLILVLPPIEGADARMRIFNRDGSEGEMCGNGIRCAAKLLYDTGIVKKTDLTIETLGGDKKVELILNAGEAVSARVDMGRPQFEPSRIPLKSTTNRVRLSHEGKEIGFFCLSLGNPHAVTNEMFPEDAELKEFGSAFETAPIFPNRSNILFAKVDRRDLVEVKVWERGSGATRACGTGATASVIALNEMNLCDPEVRAILPGGSLQIEYDRKNARAYMTGSCVTVFTGELERD